MTLTLSVDHRVADGVAGAEFLSDLRALIEEPRRALL
jgi:pyruvate/2-oxoglutarate dehydrogenase complex dihydrolipoamide acyltransferase (E2) component